MCNIQSLNMTLVLCLVLVQITLVFCQRQPYTPYYFVCPGINQTSTRTQVKVGIMLSMPTTNEIKAAGINISSYDLIPGEMLIPLSHMAVSAFEQGEIINTEGIILPEHDLCLYFTFVPPDLKDISLGSNYVYGHSRTYQTVNALQDNYQFRINRDLMVSYGNMVNVASITPMFDCPIDPNALNAMFSTNSVELHNEGCEPGIYKTNFNMQSSSIELVKAGKLFVESLGWNRYGVLTSCSSQEIWQNNERGIFLSNINGNFEQNFQIFRDNEIKVFLFIGTVCSYFDMLIQAYDFGVSTSENFAFVFTIQSFAPICHLKRSIKRYCAKKFTEEDIFKILTSFDKTIIIHPLCKNSFDPNDKSALHVLKEQCQRRLMSDAVTTSALAADNFFTDKAIELGLNKSTLVIDKLNYTDVTNQLINVSFHGESGFLQFNKQCQRISNTFLVANMIMDLKTASFDDRVLDYKAFIYTYDEEVKYFNDSNTLIRFKDNTTNIPSDTYKRIYKRTHGITGLIFAVLFPICLIVSAYIICVWQSDVRALIYSEKWLIKQCDINYSLGSKLQARLGKLSQTWADRMNISKLNGSAIGIYNGDIVYCHKQALNLKNVTVNMRKVFLQAIGVSHKNLSRFYGCIIDSDKIVGIMYEHTSRGTLQGVLMNSNFEFNETFRISFTLDILHGLQFLHCKKVIHGRLQLANCLLDEHWSLKLTNFAIPEFHIGNEEEKTIIVWKAPECRLGVTSPNIKADTYSLGMLLKSMCSRQSLLCASSEDELVYDLNLPIVYEQVIDDCTRTVANDRPTLDVVKWMIKTISVDINVLRTENFGALEMYSTNLEKQVEDVTTKLNCEKERTDAILGHYIPETVVSKVRDGATIPIRRYPKGVLLYIKFNHFGELIGQYHNDIASGIISNIDKSLDSICKMYQLERVQCTGSVWIFIGGVYSNVETSPVIGAVEAALEVMQRFEENTNNLTVNIAIHCGSIVCGLLTQRNPVHITAGDTFNHGLLLLSLCIQHKIVISEEFNEKLQFYNSNDTKYCIRQCNPIPIKNGVEPIQMYSVVKHSTPTHSRQDLGRLLSTPYQFGQSDQ